MFLLLYSTFSDIFIKNLKIISQPIQEYTFKTEYQPLEAVPPKDALERYSGNIKQTYERTTMLKCDFENVAKRLTETTLQDRCFSENMLDISRTLFYMNTFG